MTTAAFLPRPRRLAACAALAFVLPATAQANALLELYEQARGNDKTLLAAQYQRDAALEAKPQARAAFMPQINGRASYTRQESERSFSAAQFGGPPGATVSQENENKERDFSLSLSQALFNWEAIQNLRKADDQVALAETGYRAAQQDLILRVAAGYFNLLAASDTLRFAEAENKAVERQLEQFKQRFEVGLSAITDVQEAQARYDLTVALKINAETALTSARRVLTEITGNADPRVAAVPENFPMPGPDPLTPATWADAARRDNLNVLAARLQAELAGADVKLAYSRHMPTLSLEGGYSDSSGDFTSQTGGDPSSTSPQESKGSQLALIARVPIFAGGAIRSGVRAATATANQRQAQLESAARTAERQTGDAYQGVLAGVARVNAFKQAVLSSKTALEASEVGLSVGARTSIDVLNAQQQLYAAQRDYARARYDYLLSVLQLKLSAGRLGDADLAEIDRLLVGG